MINNEPKPMNNGYFRIFVWSNKHTHPHNMTIFRKRQAEATLAVMKLSKTFKV